jgi:hypothetical protein
MPTLTPAREEAREKRAEEENKQHSKLKIDDNVHMGKEKRG